MSDYYHENTTVPIGYHLKFSLQKGLVNMGNAQQQQDNHVIFAGFLEKQSLYDEKFRKRWIVLKQDGKLHCYKTKPMKNKPTEIIGITSFTSSHVDHDHSQLTLKYHDQKRVFKAKSKLIEEWTRIMGKMWENQTQLMKRTKLQT